MEIVQKIKFYLNTTIKDIFSVFIFIVFSFNSGHASAQMSSKDQADIRKKAKKVLIEYEERINILGSNLKSIDKTRINIEEFLKLFVDRKTQVFNDLDPAHKLSEYYEAESYSSNMALWYPNGIAIRIDFENGQVSNIITHGEDVFTIDYIIDKQIRGAYLGKTQNFNTERLLFRIGFSYSRGQYINFKIVGIRKSTEKEFTEGPVKLKDVKGVQFSPDNKRDIDRETNTLLNDYANYLSLIGDTVENIEEKIMYKQSFRGLFVSDQTNVYNDILPDSRINLYVPVTDYINLYSEAYASDGGKVLFQLDSADLGYITKVKDTLFYRQVEVKKTFEGNYLGRRKVSYSHIVMIRVVFQYSNMVYKKFRIEKIEPAPERKAGPKEELVFTDLQKHKPVAKKPEIPPPAKVTEKPATVSGSKIKIDLTAGFFIGLCKISDENLNSLTKAKNGLVWETKSSLGYSFYIHYTYALTPSFGLVTGVGFMPVSTTYSMNSQNEKFIFEYATGKKDTIDVFKDPVESHDTNTHGYYKLIQAKYEKVLSASFVNIPIGINYHFNISNKIQVFFKPVINIGLIIKATSKENGYINHWGYSPGETDSIFKIKNWIKPENGFYFYDDTFKNVTKSVKPEYNAVHFVLNTSCGFTFSFSKMISLSLSGNFQYGLNDMSSLKGNYVDHFGQTEKNVSDIPSQHTFVRKPVRLIGYGAVLEINIKF
jgi:hypothetical protein